MFKCVCVEEPFLYKEIAIYVLNEDAPFFVTGSHTMMFHTLVVFLLF